MEPFPQLPPLLARRLGSLRAYVDAVVAETEVDEPPERRLSKNERSAIHTALFVRELVDLMNDFTGAAKNTAVLLKSMNVDGFQIGSASFSENSTDTLRGERLAAQLESKVALDLEKQPWERLAEQIKRMRREALHARRLA